MSYSYESPIFMEAGTYKASIFLSLQKLISLKVSHDMRVIFAMNLPSFIFRILIEHAKGVERGVGGVPYRGGGGSSYSSYSGGNVAARKQRAREK